MSNQEQLVTHPLLNESPVLLEKLAAQYGFSPEAAWTVWQALLSSGGTMAQFSHPELGGIGQWTRGGMIMIGDMFNHALKARVGGLCSELAQLLQKQTTQGANQNAADHWWGADLGAFAASGSQNNVHYAYFPAARRLAVLQDGRVTIYDTGDHNITGVSQGQSTADSLAFTSRRGAIRLTDLSVVPERSTTTPPSSAASPEKSSRPNLGRERSEEIFYQLERLAELKEKSILSEEEFVSKKTELLSRL